MHHMQLESRGWLGGGRLGKAYAGCGPRRTRLTTRCQQTEDGGGQRFYGGFVRAPLRAEPVPRVRPCSRCNGTTLVPCQECSGAGRLPKGGYQKKNPPLNAARVIGSKWTAMERTFGWRHFRITQKRKEGSDLFVLMVSTCDETTQFWLNMRNLRDRRRWAAGWLQKAEIMAAQELAGAECKGCGGTGSLPCPLCSKAGEVVEL